MKLAPTAPWNIEVPPNDLTRKFAPKMENIFQGGWVVNTVSNPGLLLKHILWQAYTKSNPVGLGVAARKDITHEGVYEAVMAGETGNRVTPEYWNAGTNEIIRHHLWTIVGRSIIASVAWCL